MEYSIDTDVTKDILNHSDVIGVMDERVPVIRQLIQNRWDTMQAEMASGKGLGPEQSVNGESIFYNDTKNIALSYAMGFWSQFNWCVSLMRDATYEKESEELYGFQSYLNTLNSKGDTTDSQKKIISDKLTEIANRLNKLKGDIMNDNYNEWDDDNSWKNHLIEEIGLTEPPTEPAGEPDPRNDPNYQEPTESTEAPTSAPSTDPNSTEPPATEPTTVPESGEPATDPPES